MRLAFAEPAERDLGNIIDYISHDNPVAAEKVYRAIIETAERLTKFPAIGRAGRLPGTAEFLVPSLPYLIVYRVDAEVLTIVAVLLISRDLTRALITRL